MKMEKYIEVYNKTDGHTDRYHIIGATVDDFIEVFLYAVRDKKISVRDITKDEFDNHKNRRHSILFNIENRWEARHYTSDHTSKELEIEWNKAIANK